MKTNQKTLLFFSAAALTTFFACTKDDAAQDEQSLTPTIIDQPKGIENECSYVDAYWPSSAVLSTTLSAGAGTSSDVTLMTNQNTAIKTFWRGSSVAAPTFRFVQNGTNWSSTYNAISYSTGKIYYGEGIFRDAKSKDASNLINVMILAHEYGHQLQYAYGLPSRTESTARPNELEADGMAGYYLRRGYGKSTFASIATGYEFAYAIGDYQTTSSGHHGTPPQRRSAVRLGFLLADPANAKLSATQFDYNFFYYYTGVLNGTYRLSKPADISEETHEYIMLHMDELRRIQSGQMSDEEYFNLQ
ncbi:metalloprotease [Flavobacterium amniphilum]|uniref:metalloprotease n=1 Tax=Flavobacterium amniphilum TaxID=1834035 RepID=UPI002029F551|nr:metalloprotease [Flavobacterium amniphilum]MCL9804529.1 metalloprotease [Flavobacterium amniphilum]